MATNTSPGYAGLTTELRINGLAIYLFGLAVGFGFGALVFGAL